MVLLVWIVHIVLINWSAVLHKLYIYRYISCCNCWNCHFELFFYRCGKWKYQGEHLQEASVCVLFGLSNSSLSLSSAWTQSPGSFGDVELLSGDQVMQNLQFVAHRQLTDSEFAVCFTVDWFRICSRLAHRQLTDSEFAVCLQLTDSEFAVSWHTGSWLVHNLQSVYSSLHWCSLQFTDAEFAVDWHTGS